MLVTVLTLILAYLFFALIYSTVKKQEALFSTRLYLCTKSFFWMDLFSNVGVGRALIHLYLIHVIESIVVEFNLFFDFRYKYINYFDFLIALNNRIYIYF